MSASPDGRPIYTIGHSTRTIEEFIDILRGGEVQCVVDVRAVPRSRTNPQYNFDSLPETLSRFQMRYVLIESLGGRRSRQKNVAPQLNAFWENQSFHNYADYALSPQFRGGMDQLKHLAREVLCALMCSEAVWWRCHRRIVSDYLLADGWRVLHLMGQGRIEPAKLSSGAALASDRVIYPPE